MRIIHTYKKCSRCGLECSIEQYPYNEALNTYASACKDCVAKRHNKTGRVNRNRLVKASWLNSSITLSNGEKILTNKIKEDDKEMIIKEGFGFIFIGFDPKGTSVL